MAATLQVAGRRAHKLSSSYPRPGRSHAEPCRSRRPSLHATSCYGESFASSTVARSSSTLLRRFERLFWLDGGSATCARSRLSAQNGRHISCCLPSCASNQGFCPDDQRYLLSVGMPDLAKKGHQTQHHRHVAKIPVCLEAGGYLLLRALSPVATSPMILVHGSMGLRTTSCRNRLWAISNAGQLTWLAFNIDKIMIIIEDP